MAVLLLLEEKITCETKEKRLSFWDFLQLPNPSSVGHVDTPIERVAQVATRPPDPRVPPFRVVISWRRLRSDVALKNEEERVPRHFLGFDT